MRRLPDKLAGETPAVGKTRARGNTNGCRVRDRGASTSGRTARGCGRYGRTWTRKGKRHGAGPRAAKRLKERAVRSGNDGPAGMKVGRCGYAETGVGKRPSLCLMKRRSSVVARKYTGYGARIGASEPVRARRVRKRSRRVGWTRQW